MRFIQLSIIIGTLFISFSCNNKQSTRLKENEEQEKEDIIRKDSLSKIVWGDVLFGMSPDDVINSNAFKNLEYNKNINTIHGTDSIRQQLKLNWPFSIWFRYSENKLYRMEICMIGGKERGWWNEIKEDCDIFVNQFQNKYGKPSFWKRDMKSYQTNPDVNTQYALFAVGHKVILIQIEQAYDKYSYSIIIENDNFKDNAGKNGNISNKNILENAF